MDALTLPPRAVAIEERLRTFLNGLQLGNPCFAFQELPSTMDLAHQLALQGASEGTCVWAETQTQGRGRASRTWVSPPGGIYLSLVLRPTRSVNEVPQLALVAGLATAQAIHDVTTLSPTIRWPNDVLLEDQKVAGILVEAKSSQQLHAVVGIGINVAAEPGQLPEGAASLSQWLNPAPDRVAITGALCRHFDELYRRWQQEGFAPLRGTLVRWLGVFGCLVHITTNQRIADSGQRRGSAGSETFEVQGQALDIDDSGRLLVRLDSGLMRAFEAGEVTLLR